MANPKEVKYTKSHEWVEFISDTTVAIGLSDYAQAMLGDLVFINLPVDGSDVEIGEAICDVESVKAVSDVYSPVTGTVSEVNEELLDAPGKINDSPFEAWLFKAQNVSATESLMTFEEYETFCTEEE